MVFTSKEIVIENSIDTQIKFNLFPLRHLFLIVAFQPRAASFRILRSETWLTKQNRNFSNPLSMRPLSIFWAAAAVVFFVVFSSFRLDRVEKTFQKFSGDFVDLDTVRIWQKDCSAKADLCLDLSLAMALKMRITDNGQPVKISIQNGCDFDTTSAYTYSTLFGQGNFGPYWLTSWPVSGQVFSDTFQTMPELVGKMNQWDPTGNWMLDASHLLITGGDAGKMYDTMKVVVLQIQTPSFIGYNFGTTPRGTSMSFSKGFHEVILEDTTTLMRDTFYVYVACSSVENRVIDKDSTGKFCPVFDDLLTTPISVMMCNAGNFAVDFSLDAQNCINFKGKKVGDAQTCLVACDSTGFCDTVFLNVKVRGSGSSFFHFLEIENGASGVLCPDSSSLGGAIEQVGFCGLTQHGFADFFIEPGSKCLTYKGLATGGTDTVCMVVCDGSGVCDTTVLAVKVRRFGADWRYDTLYLNQTGKECVDTYLLAGAPKKLEAFKLPNPLMFFYNFQLPEFCVSYTGLKAGTDTLGVRLRDEFGNFDSIYLVLTILKPKLEVVQDTLLIGSTLNFCLDKSELGGSGLFAKNIYQNTSNRHVSFDIDDILLCLEMQALNPGTDTACITLCDNLGVCDSVIFIITALDDSVNPPQPPVANPDEGLSENSQPTQIRVLDNDLLPSAVTDLTILPSNGIIGPLHGKVEIDKATGLATYTPNDGFCNSTDNFQYVVCGNGGCDTALVSVLVTCDTDLELVVFDGFSPNGDKVNDTFTIQNIQNFPDAQVIVYNRWGNMVFSALNYQNDWTGDWNGRELPDGAYFYYLDDGEGDVWKGVLFIKR